MTGERRAALKQAVDARVRELVADAQKRNYRYRARCKGCDCELSSFSEGCNTCSWRWGRWRHTHGNRKYGVSDVEVEAMLREMRDRAYERVARMHRVAA